MLTCNKRVLAIQRMDGRRRQADPLDVGREADQPIQPQDGDVVQVRGRVVLTVNDGSFDTVERLFGIRIEIHE